MRSLFTVLVLCTLGAQLLGCGSDGHYVWHKTKRYDPQQPKLDLMTDQTAQYVVAKRERGSKLVALDETASTLHTGKIFGFRRDDSGHTIAYTYRGEHDLGVMGPNVKYLCWIRRDYQEPESGLMDEIIDELLDVDDCKPTFTPKQTNENKRPPPNNHKPRRFRD